MIRFPSLMVLSAVSLTGAAHAATAQAEGEKYSIAVVAPDDLKAGASGTYKLTITPKEGYQLKVETPFKAELTSPTGVKIARDKFGNADFDDPKTAHKSVSTAITPSKSGENHVVADVSFFICNDELCERFKAKPDLAFTVK